MPVLSFLKSTRKITGLISFAAGSALLVPLLTSSQVVPPAPAARLQPASLAVDLAPDGAPVDLTSTLSNIGGGTLTWRVGSVRDVSAPSAPAVASGPVAIARVYDKANLERATWAAGELIVGVKEPAAAPGVQSAQAAPAAFGSGRFKVKREMIKAKRGTRSANGAKRLAAPLLRPGRKLYVVNVDDKTKTGMQKAIDDLRKDPNVVYAEPNYRLKAINLPDDPDFGLLYGMHNEGQTGGVADADIDAPEAWDTYTGDHNVIVGVIDTGIDYLHPDLVDNMWTNPGEIPANGLDDDGNGYVDDVHGYDFANHDSDPMDDHFHGTHCAGTIAGSGNNGLGVTGVAWKAKLAALKFLDAGGSGTLEAAVEAIAYANAMDIPITSNSWGGGGFSQALKDVIDAGAERGFLFVAAAGNDANDNDQFPSYPATYESENILAVAATDSRDDMASFSSFGATTVDLGAPGVDVYSCFPNGQYQYLSGTSMATPHVSGAAALLKSYNPQLGYVELKAALLAGVDPVPSLNGRVLSNGRLNVSKALNGVSPPWVVIAPRGQGELAPGASQLLTVTVDPKGLTAGEHSAIIPIATNDPKAPIKELKVNAKVSGCRSLTISSDVTPPALDFGAVWTGASKRLALTLVNKCNDFTTVSSIASSLKTFVPSAVPPLRIPPFGMVSVEIAYTPDDLVADKAVITIKSNAQDNPTLKANASGTGVRPPAIAATPANVSLTLDPSEQKTSIVKVTNNGGADLVVALNTLLERKAPSATAPKLAVAARKTGAPYARAGSARADLRPKTAHPMVRASASGLKVLHLSTLFYPDSAEDQFSSAIRSLPQVALLDRVDGSNSVPNADYLLGYDVVLVSADYAWADPIATGDALAEYVDRGGRVCLLVASIALGGGFEMQGRIGTPDYLPLVKEVGGSYGFANAFADHPITLGLTSLDCGMPTAASQTQGAGISLGQYDNGALIGAVNAVLPVVAINVFPADGFWGGDLILMMSNTLDFLAGNGNWVKVEPANLVVPAGMTLEATLTFDTEKLDAGAYAGALELRHNAPAGANPLAIPLALTVTAKNCLETAVSTVDFGKVWTDRRGMATVTLANPCNRPTRVTSLALSPKVFKTTATAPFDVPAFSEVSVELSYVPDDLTPDNGSLVVKSDAKDHPTLTLLLKGTGIKPPSISVKPASLSLTLDPGAKAAKTLDVYNAGGDSLRVLVKAKSLDEAAKSLGAAQLKPGRPATLRPQIGAPLASRSHASARGFRPLAGGSLKVLFLHGIYMPSEGNDFVMGLRELANVASVDLVDLSMFTPNAAYLADYDVVLVGTDYPAADPVATGDALADYVDAGGKVILCAASFYASEPWALGGRIMDPAYQPILPEYTYYGGASVSLADHPINKGVAGIYSGNVIGTSGVQGAGQPLGTYETGFLTGAFNPEKPVVSLNFYPIEGYWGGDILLLMGNTFDFLANSIRWMKPAVSEFSVGPGKTFKLSVAITAEEMAAGKYQGLLSFQHNAPQGPAPLDVPVALQVRSKRCLTLNPMSMDFGAVWKGGFGQQELSLVNACNEPTTVTAFRAADAAFPAPDSTPLVVGPYSTVRVNVTFAPKDAKLHQSRLDVLSNAAGASTLSVTLKGQGILPPTISVNPASLKESANAGEIKKRVIAVSNKGGDTLDVELRTQAAAEGKAVGQASAPALAKGIGAAVAPYVPGGAVSSFRRLASLPKAKAAGHRILYFTTIIPDSGFGDGFISGLRSLPDVAVLDVKSGAFVTPNADFFLGYDQVVVAANYPFADPVALGDALAEYVDRGGRLCLMSAAISNLKGVGLQGRIASPEYLPMTQEGKGKGGPVSSFEDHPINAGIQFLWSLAPTSSTQVQGDGRPLGFLQNGILLGAWNSTKPVVALNVMPADGAWGGDLIPMMGNIFNHLAKGGGWLSVEPRSLRVAPGGSVEAVVSFDGTKIRAGAHNGSVDLAHNVPGKPPVSVPAAFTVGGRLGLEASAKALDFGPVLIGNSVSDTVSLANTGNLPVTVTAALTGNPAFSLSFNPFPLVLEPGEAVAVNAVFTPVANGSAPAQLSFATEGLAPVVVALNGVGQRPASLAVASSPSPLKFSVPVGGQASGQLSLSDLGDEALRYGMKLQLGAGTGAVKAAADPAQAYGPEHYTLLAKGANDLRVGHPAALSAGGPDGYGYRWFDSKAAGGAAYAWIDISAGGRRLDKVSACDDCSEPADLSFAFPFYGESHKGVNVGSNGYLTFGPVGDAFSNHPLPSKVMPTRLVAALFQDLYPAGGGSIYFQDFGDKAVVQYQAVPDFRGTGVYDFQIVLFPDGTIDLQYQRLTGVKNTATVGIQNGAGDDGLTVAYNADYLKNKLAVRIRTWLGVPQQSGNLPGLGSKTLNLSVDSRSLPVGAHKGTLSVSGGGVQSTRTVDMPVELIVKPK
jgi:subtilisin family serine protease